MKTGKRIWEMSLPFPGTASPAMYMVDGRQYIAFATSSGRAPKLKEKGVDLLDSPVTGEITTRRRYGTRRSDA